MRAQIIESLKCGDSGGESGKVFAKGNTKDTGQSSLEEIGPTRQLTFKSATDSNVVVKCREGDDGDVEVEIGVYYV